MLPLDTNVKHVYRQNRVDSLNELFDFFFFYSLLNQEHDPEEQIARRYNIK